MKKKYSLFLYLIFCVGIVSSFGQITVSSIVRENGNPTNISDLTYRLTLSSGVSGLSSANFILVTTGTIVGAKVTGVGPVTNGSCNVSVNSGTGSGTIKLVLDNSDGLSSPVSGLPFTGGQVYDIDKNAPRVTYVTSEAANKTYKAGDVIGIQVAFVEPVSVGLGTPQLNLRVGVTSRAVNLTSGSGTNILLFNYTVQSDDVSPDLDYFSSTALTFNGSTIKDEVGNTAVLTLPEPGAAGSLGANRNLVVDGAAPQITSVSLPASGTYKAGSNLDFTVNFTENVEVNTSGNKPRLTLTIGGTTKYANYFSASANTIVFRYTVSNGDLDADGIALGNAIGLNSGTLKDLAGNNAILTLNSVGNTAEILVDAVAPNTTATTLSISNDNGVSQSDFITNAATQTVSGTLSANLQSGERVLYSFDNWTTINEATSAVGSSTWSFNNTFAGSATIYVAVADQVGNRSMPLNQSFTLDLAAPTVAITTNRSVLKAGETATITFTFSENVFGFVLGDISVSGGELTGLSVFGNTYTSTFTPTADVNSGTASITIPAGSYMDVAGSGGGSGSMDLITYDTQPPAAPMIITPTNGSVISNNSPTLSGTAETASSVTIYVDGVAVGNTTSYGGNWTYVMTSALSEGAHYVTATATDLRGNGSVTSAATTFQVNTALPVNLIFFNVKADNNVAKLQWRTASEQKNKGFEIYRSGDDMSFIKLGELVGLGTNTDGKNYSFTDGAPLNGNNYYKLVQTDIDGKQTELGIKAISFFIDAQKVVAYPNPVINKVAIQIPNAVYTRFMLLDVSGKILGYHSIKNNQTAVSLDLSAYARGLYFVRLIGNEKTEAIKLTKN